MRISQTLQSDEGAPEIAAAVAVAVAVYISFKETMTKRAAIAGTSKYKSFFLMFQEVWCLRCFSTAKGVYVVFLRQKVFAWFLYGKRCLGCI